MDRYRKKPIVVEAVQFGLDNASETAEWCGGLLVDAYPHRPFIKIETLEGTLRADLLDYVIRGVKGEFYPCKPDIFDATYEKVES